jgi:hypothetical protein
MERSMTTDFGFGSNLAWSIGSRLPSGKSVQPTEVDVPVTDDVIKRY